MPGPPAFDTPPDHIGAGALRVWFTDPPGSIVQLMRPSKGTLEMAAWLVGPGFARLRGRFVDARGLILVMDLSLMEGRDPAARALILEKAREVHTMFERVFLIPPIKTNPVYLTTLHAAAALMKALGADIRIESSLDKVIAERGLKPAAALPTAI